MKPLIAVPAIFALTYRAYSRQSLTAAGIVAALVTAVIHALHPWSVFFALLATFFLAGTAATKVKHDVKARLTTSATGGSGGEGQRTHIQVLANSVIASALILGDLWLGRGQHGEKCWEEGGRGKWGDVLVIGIVANYAAVAADTLSSELGILSSSAPRLITAPWRTVPRGTNGGVTLAGVMAGAAGSLLISSVAGLMIPFCKRSEPRSGISSWFNVGGSPQGGWTVEDRLYFVGLLTLAGFGGTLLDSLLGALLQASVVDTRTGLVVEGDGGRKVLVSGSSYSKSEGGAVVRRSHRAEVRGKITGSAEGKERAEIENVDKSGKDGVKGRRMAEGRDLLDNNAVNVLMAALSSIGAMAAAAWIWGISG